MKKFGLTFNVLIILFVCSIQAWGQFTADEVAEWARWEAFLAEAPIVQERVGRRGRHNAFQALDGKGRPQTGRGLERRQ